jgi:hypothetical protein
MPQQRDTRILAVSVATSGDNQLVAAPGSGGGALNVGGAGFGAVTVWQLELEAAGAVNLQFKSGSTAIGGAIVLTGAGSTVTLNQTGAPWFKCAAGQALVLNLSAAIAVTGTIYYTVG